MPRLLSPDHISSFRLRLCEAAERLFAAHGPSGVTMRQLAVELECSPMTPYRYFKDKDEILAEVRAAAFGRLADRLEAAVATDDGDLAAVSQAVAAAYIAFVHDEPNAYRLMFDLAQPDESAYPGLAAASRRVRETVGRRLVKVRQTGAGAPNLVQLGDAQWAAVHGALMLELAGKLPPHLDLGAFVRELVERLCAGAAAAPLSRPAEA